MFPDRLITAGFILGLALGITAFTHGARTADSSRPMDPQAVQTSPLTTSPNGLGVGP